MGIEADIFSSSLELESDFEKSCGLKIKTNLLGSKLTTFRIGGPVQFLIEPQNHLELDSALKWLSLNKQVYRFLGYGSNLLIDSTGLRGWLIRLGTDFSKSEPLGNGCFKVGAAYSLTTLSRELCQAGFSGLEFAGGIPASIGGAIRMNAGAHTGEMSSVVKAIEGYDSKAGFIRFASNEIQFDYRKCTLSQDFLITAVELQLISSVRDQVLPKLLSNLEYRKKTQPLTLASAGSIFRNPSAAISAGALLDRLAMKGSRRGEAQISDLHANWIVNPNKRATSKEVLELIAECQKIAQEREGIRLQPEVVVW
jgi:UDP-N-acetylmuramate dehydrogenase